MIDFRYHIVSLIAVFFALAVGVVLGAGPLQGTLGDQLTEQVEALRQDNEQRRAEIEELTADTTGLELFVDAASERLVPGSLEETDIAVVELPGSDPEVAEALLARVEQAGGEVVGRLAVNPRWTDPGEDGARDDAAELIGPGLPTPPGDDVPAAQVLGAGLGQALTQESALAPGTFTTGASDAYAALLAAELVSETTAPSRPADAVLVLAPAPAADADVDDRPALLELELATVVGLDGTDAVVVGSDEALTDLVDAIRADADAAEAVATVDSGDDAAGQVLAPLALASVVYGDEIGHYGVEEGATSVLPPAVERPEDEPTDGETDGATDEPTDGASEEAGS